MNITPNKILSWKLNTEKEKYYSADNIYFLFTYLIIVSIFCAASWVVCCLLEGYTVSYGGRATSKRYWSTVSRIPSLRIFRN